MNGTQERLSAIWLELLKVQDAQPDDDFFRRGGHSYLALLLTRAIHREFGLTFGLADIYRHRTLSAQVGLIEPALSSADPAARGAQ
jgi:hypothetical protein